MRAKLPWPAVIALQAVLALSVGAFAAALGGCGTGGGVKAPPPVPRAEHTLTTEVRYVPIDAALTAPCQDVAGGKPSEVFDTVAALRRSLAECSGRVINIGTIEGTKP